MIKSDFGKILIKGNTPLLMSEFSSLVHGLIEENIFTKEEIEELVRIGVKTKKQLINEFNERHKDGISTAEMQEYAKTIVEARKSGIINEKEEREPQIRTVVDNDKYKVTEISIDTKGKSEKEIEKEISKALNKAFNKDNLEEKYEE